MAGAVKSNHAKLQLGRARAVVGAVKSNHARCQGSPCQNSKAGTSLQNNQLISKC